MALVEAPIPQVILSNSFSLADLPKRQSERDSLPPQAKSHSAVTELLLPYHWWLLRWLSTPL